MDVLCNIIVRLLVIAKEMYMVPLLPTYSYMAILSGSRDHMSFTEQKLL